MTRKKRSSRGATTPLADRVGNLELQLKIIESAVVSAVLAIEGNGALLAHVANMLQRSALQAVDRAKEDVAALGVGS